MIVISTYSTIVTDKDGKIVIGKVNFHISRIVEGLLTVDTVSEIFPRRREPGAVAAPAVVEFDEP